MQVQLPRICVAMHATCIDFHRPPPLQEPLTNVFKRLYTTPTASSVTALDSLDGSDIFFSFYWQCKFCHVVFHAAIAANAAKCILLIHTWTTQWFIIRNLSGHLSVPSALSNSPLPRIGCHSLSNIQTVHFYKDLYLLLITDLIRKFMCYQHEYIWL